MVIVQPAQEREIFGDDFGVDAAWVGLEMGNGARHQGAHLAEVGDRQMNVGQGIGDRLGQSVTPVLGKRIQNDNDERFPGLADAGTPRAIGLSRQGEDRMEQGTHGDTALRELPHHAVNQEGPIVLHDAKHIVGRLAARRADEGRYGNPGGLTGRAFLAPAPGVC